MGGHWYILHNGQQGGPYTEDQLKEMAKQGQLQRKDFIWTEGMQDWTEAASRAGLFVGPPPPPPPNSATPSSPPPIKARDVLNRMEDAAVGLEASYHRTIKRAKNEGYHNRLTHVAIGIVAGVLSGYAAATFFPLWGGLWAMGEPFSDARRSLAPGHIALFIAVFSALGYWRGFVLDKQTK